MTRVRDLRNGDVMEWRALWRAYLAFYRTELPEAIFDETFSRMVDRGQPDQFGLVAERDGRLVGIAHCILHRHGWRPEGVCYLQDLYVAPERRGLGTGRLLIEAVYAAADALGRSEVYWLTEIDNDVARRLYDRIGTATPFVKYRRPGR